MKSVSSTVLTCEWDGWAGCSIHKLFSHVKSASGVLVGVFTDTVLTCEVCERDG